MADYYVDSAGSNTAPYDTWAKAATDPQTVADTATAGDTIKARGTFTQAATLDFDTNQGTAASPILFIGYNAGGTDDGTPFVLDGNSAATNNINNNARTSLIMRNIKGINATSTGFAMTGSPIACHQDNCEFSSSGLYGTNYGAYYRCSQTRIRTNNNTNIGQLNASVESTGAAWEAIGNGAVGVYLNNSITVSHILAHDNAAAGIQINNAKANAMYFTCDTNVGPGITGVANHAKFIGGLCTNNTTYGINSASSYATIAFYMAYYNNTTAEENPGSGSITNIGKMSLSADPYTDRANDDFSIASDSELINAIEIGGDGATTTAYLTSGGIPPQYTSGGGARRSRGQYYGRG